MLGFLNKKKEGKLGLISMVTGFGLVVGFGGGRLGVGWVSQWISGLVIGHSICLQGRLNGFVLNSPILPENTKKNSNQSKERKGLWVLGFLGVLR